ncbi:MAG: serine hydrolase domain-containing protein [Bacteroidales bacterium]
MKSFSFSSFIAALTLLVLSAGCNNPAPAETTLPRSTPEAEGVSSEELLTFLDSAAAGSHEFHSIMIVRHGKVIAEGWWDPYSPELRHTLYSVSKSFTSTAVGLAVTEKLLSVDDKVVSFFPDQLPDTVSPFLADMTVRDLLTMTAGQSPDPSNEITSSGKNWVTAFLSLPVVNDPGSQFLYNSMATFMLSAIVQKVTGEKLADYLQPRLFGPLGIEGMDWESSPEGINAGGWGLRVRTEDMAKFGQLYLQKGMWNGKQIIPAEWIEEATSFKIDQAPDASPETTAENDWMQGYCYQFWRSRHNTYRADGAFGQYIMVMPEKDAVVAITSESPDMQDVMYMVWNHILPAMKEEALPENQSAAEKLSTRLASLALPVPAKTEDSPVAETIRSNRFLLEENNLKLKYLTLDFAGDACNLSLGNGKTVRTIPFGRGEWITSRTEMVGPGILRRPGVSSSNLVAGAFTWEDDSTLVLILRYIESPHHLKMTCRFVGDTVEARIRQSTPPGYDLPVLKGVMAR